jgi:PBP1b-binding outer membrane lipoprotein LpoB
MKTRLIVIIAAIILLTGCSQSTQAGNPPWVDQMIKKFESEPVGRQSCVQTSARPAGIKPR